MIAPHGKLFLLFCLYPVCDQNILLLQMECPTYTLCANEKALWFCVYQCVVAYMCSLACLLMCYPVFYHMFTHLLAYAFVCVFVDTFCSRADRLNSPYKRPVPWPFIMHTHSHTNTQIVFYPHTSFHTHIHPLVWSSLVFQVVQQCASATLK